MAFPNISLFRWAGVTARRVGWLPILMLVAGCVMTAKFHAFAGVLILLMCGMVIWFLGVLGLELLLRLLLVLLVVAQLALACVLCVGLAGAVVLRAPDTVATARGAGIAAGDCATA
jgi:hypothetical protein